MCVSFLLSLSLFLALLTSFLSIAAILTARIHSLSAHLISSPRDIQNRQALRQLISKRTTVLKYLRAVSVTRYEDCLEKIGVEPRAVEGEVIVTKAELRTMIRGN
jgi:small subunit ribosomal protein S15